MPPPAIPETGLAGPSYWNPDTGQWEPLAQNAEGVYYNPILAPGRADPYSAQAEYGRQEAASRNATERLSAQALLAKIRQGDSAANASLQSAQAAMKNAQINADDLKERMRQFDITSAEGRRQFDLSFGLDRERFELQRQQLKLEGAQTILNAPRGPADFFAYAARALPAAQAGGSALENIFGRALEGVSGESLASLRQGPVLSNTELATNLVKASRGEAVSDATSTFLRRSLGVSVPGETEVAQQQAAQQAQAAPAAAPAAPYAGPGMAPWAVLPFEQWLVQQGYDTPMVGQGGEVVEYAQSQSPDLRDLYFSGAMGQSAGDRAKGNMYRPGQKWSLGVDTLRQQYDQYALGTRANEASRQEQMAASPAFVPYQPVAAGGTGGGGGTARSGNPVLDAIMSGGRSFNERLGSLAGQIPRGYGTSLQEYNRLGPSLQAMYTSLLSESGIETPEDFLAGVVRAAPNFGPSRMARSGIR